MTVRRDIRGMRLHSTWIIRYERRKRHEQAATSGGRGESSSGSVHNERLPARSARQIGATWKRWRNLEDAWNKKLEAVKEQRLVKFDSRTLIALGAIALSIGGYVIQDARSTARQDSEIEATKARVQRLEQIAATNTEGRIRTEVQLGELRDGQIEIKAMIEAHDSAGKKGIGRK